MNSKEYLAIGDAYKKLYATEEELQEKDTYDQVAAVIDKDRAKKGTDYATYDSMHGKKKAAKRERDYAAFEREKMKRDAQRSGHPWEHAKGSTTEKEGKKSEKTKHVRDPQYNSYDPLTLKDQQGLADAYLAVCGEDKKYGYDKKGQSLNPADIEKRKRKDDDLFGAPNKKVKKEEKNWIQGAVKRPGAFTKKAKAHDMPVQKFAKYVDDHPDKFDTRTKRQANLAQTFASMKKEGADFDALSAFLINEGADEQAVSYILANWDPSLGK